MGTQSPLLNLPAEIRLEIYSHLYSHGVTYIKGVRRCRDCYRRRAVTRDWILNEWRLDDRPVDDKPPEDENLEALALENGLSAKDAWWPMPYPMTCDCGTELSSKYVGLLAYSKYDGQDFNDSMECEDCLPWQPEGLALLHNRKWRTIWSEPHAILSQGFHKVMVKKRPSYEDESSRNPTLTLSWLRPKDPCSIHGEYDIWTVDVNLAHTCRLMRREAREWLRWAPVVISSTFHFRMLRGAPLLTAYTEDLTISVNMSKIANWATDIVRGKKRTRATELCELLHSGAMPCLRKLTIVTHAGSHSRALVNLSQLQRGRDITMVARALETIARTVECPETCTVAVIWFRIRLDLPFEWQLLDPTDWSPWYHLKYLREEYFNDRLDRYQSERIGLMMAAKDARESFGVLPFCENEEDALRLKDPVVQKKLGA